MKIDFTYKRKFPEKNSRSEKYRKKNYERCWGEGGGSFPEG